MAEIYYLTIRYARHAPFMEEKGHGGLISRQQVSVQVQVPMQV